MSKIQLIDFGFQLFDFFCATLIHIFFLHNFELLEAVIGFLCLLICSKQFTWTLCKFGF